MFLIIYNLMVGVINQRVVIKYKLPLVKMGVYIKVSKACKSLTTLRDNIFINECFSY